MKPTTDIVEELRLYNRWRRGDEAITAPDPTTLGKLLDDAADRIEHLFASGIHTCHADCQRPMCVLRRERDKAHADLARVTAERDSQRADIERLVWNLGGCDTIASGWGKPGDYNKEMALPALGSVSRMASERDALRARVAEVEKEAMILRGTVEAVTTQRQQAEQRNTELVAALREVDEIVNDANHSAEDRLCAAANRLLNTRAESATPAKHPDTERGVKHARKLNGLAAWLEHEADVRKACATNEGDRWDAMRMSECAEAIREYAARKQETAR